jgi:hypothetical protein
MMTKNNSSVTAVVRKIAIVPLVLILAITLSFSQENLPKDSLMNYANNWWYPILQKHNIELAAFNNFENVFEIGTTNSLENGIVTLTDALFIFNEGDKYRILKSPLAYHDLDKKIISGDEGVMEVYKLDSEGSSPNEKHTFKKFVFQLSTDKIKEIKLGDAKGQIKTKK